MQRKWVKISVGFLSLLTVGSLFWGYQAQRISHQQQRQVTRLKQQNSQLQRLQARTHGQLIVAKDAQKTAENAKKAAENNRGVSAKTQNANQQLVKTVEDVFEGLFNYTPTTYANRGAKLKAQLTPALYQQYFGKQQGNYGDGSEVTSKLTKVNVYQQSVSGSQLKVLVVAKYQSKYATAASWHRGTSVYEVTYQPDKKQVSAISSVVSKND